MTLYISLFVGSSIFIVLLVITTGIECLKCVPVSICFVLCLYNYNTGSTNYISIHTYLIFHHCYQIDVKFSLLTLTVLVATIDAQWEGMGDVGSAKYKPTLLPPCPTVRVLSYSNW